MMCCNCNYEDTIYAEEQRSTHVMSTQDPMPQGPQAGGVCMYRTVPDGFPPDGVVIRRGVIHYLQLSKFAGEMELLLYDTGFKIQRPPESTSKANGPDINLALGRNWSPFSVLAKCNTKRKGPDSRQFFVLTIFRSDDDAVCHYFANSGKSAREERNSWLQVIASSLQKVTLSLFPTHKIEVTPIPDVESTYTRIMAGYLLFCEDCDGIAVLYCELRSYALGEASFAMYKDHRCTMEVSTLPVTSLTVINTYEGFYCNLILLDVHLFCARTVQEKDLWLRALINVRAKLAVKAPDPTMTDLAMFRAAVSERVRMLPNASAHEERVALLPLKPREPTPASPRGDQAKSPQSIQDSCMGESSAEQGVSSYSSSEESPFSA